jgi:thymidylate kinase
VRATTFTVALVGPDGTGKTTVSRRLEAALPFPVKTVYMGINPETSRLMLPTTRLLLSLRRARGGDTRLVASSDPNRRRPAQAAGARRVLRDAKSGLGVVNWLAEEWFRQGVAWYHRLRGNVIVFDRHFYPDYYHFDIAPTSHSSRPLARRIHGFHLERLYPKPDLVVCLDAPAEVIAGRKPEATIEWLEGRRRQYLEMAEIFPSFAVVDATAPLEQVTSDVARAILDFLREAQAEPGAKQAAGTAS